MLHCESMRRNKRYFDKSYKVDMELKLQAVRHANQGMFRRNKLSNSERQEPR